MWPTIRNIAIIAVLAAAVDFIPGGGRAAQTLQQAVYIVFLATIGWAVSIMYRQHRTSLYSLGDRRRALLYASVGALVLVLSALYRVSGLSAVLALIVAALAIYAICVIIWSARQY
jgi:steroid 5-alpha reductase family enzyme